MSEYEIASLALAETRVGIMQTQIWVAALVGLVQCSLIAWGLWMMRGAGQQRDVQLTQQADQFATIGQALERQGQALERQGRVLEELLRRSM